MIQAVARRDQARMLVDGMTAANDLGLSDAVPGKIIVPTGARLRPIKPLRRKRASACAPSWARLLATQAP